MRKLGLFNLEMRLRALITVYKYFIGRSEGEGTRLSSVVPTDRTRDDGHTTHEIPSDHKEIIILL